MNELTGVRLTASQWHSGQFSELYKLASSGTFDCLETLRREINETMFEAFHQFRNGGIKRKDLADVYSLYCEYAEGVRKDTAGEIYEFWHRRQKDYQGFPVRCRANGKLKTWKTRIHDFKLPVKYGLKHCFYLERINADDWVSAP
jgi:hypothetical protein